MVPHKHQEVPLGKYELGRTLGEGNFGKVKLANHIESGLPFAVKILDKNMILHRNISHQIKREIATLKLLNHPNVVRLHEVLASKSKIYMVLEYVNGGELLDRISSEGKLPETQGRKLFQQLIDGVSYCHHKGVFHRDLKLENILTDATGNIKISDFRLSALPQHFRDDGLLHTTCGTPNYVAPEILSNRGYDGATSDTWSCGVILYVILTGYLPFDDRNLAVLYQKIFKGDAQIPEWLSPGAQNLIRRILDPNPVTRITMADIKTDEWFKQDYSPTEEEDMHIETEAFSMHELVHPLPEETSPRSPTLMNAFQLIGMSSCLDLSGFFEKEDVSERKMRFTSDHSIKDLLEKIEDIVTEMGFRIQKKNARLKVVQERKEQRSLGSLSVAAEEHPIDLEFEIPMEEKKKKLVIGLSWEPKLPPLPSLPSVNSNSKIKSNAESSALWKSSKELVDGLFVPTNDPRKLNKFFKSEAKDTLGKDWFNMPAPTMTPELQKDLQLLKLRSVLDPKRHYKKAELKSKGLPKYFQVGTVVESATDFFSGRLTKKERKPTLAEEILSDRALGAYRKRKVREIEEQNRPGGNEKWKIKGGQSRKRAKERRH